MKQQKPLSVHSRHVPVETARRDLAAILDAWSGRHALTLPEELLLLTEYVQCEIRSAVRAEREDHPD